MSRKPISFRTELPLLVWLVIVWGALWRDFSPADMVLPCAVLVGVAVVTFVIGARRQEAQ